MGRRALLVLVVTLGGAGSGSVLVPAPVRAASSSEPGAGVVDFDGLMAEAERQRSAGDHAAAARSYAAAYRGLSDAERSGLLGELAVDNALVAYGEARELQPTDRLLLEEPAALLDEFVTARASAHEGGRAEAVPERLEEELARLQEQLAEQPAQGDGPPPAPGSDPGPARDQDRSPRPSRTDVAILSGGAVALVAGAALIGGGAWNFVAVNRGSETRSNEIESGDFSPQRREQYRAELIDWQNRWRGVAAGLVVTGSLLAAAGVGLTTWGILRMRRNRAGSQRRSVGLPMLVPGGIGVMVSVGAGARRDLGRGPIP